MSVQRKHGAAPAEAQATWTKCAERKSGVLGALVLKKMAAAMERSGELKEETSHPGQRPWMSASLRCSNLFKGKG